MRNATDTQSLSVEQLEERLLLAVGVAANSLATGLQLVGTDGVDQLDLSVENGELTLGSDDGLTAANPQTVQNLAPFVTAVTGLSGNSVDSFTLNQQATEALLSGQVPFGVDLGAAEDTVRVSGEDTDRVLPVIVPGTGDVLELSDTQINDDFELTGPDGGGAIFIDNVVFGGDVNATFGAGDDTVVVTNSVFLGDVSADFDGGDDTLVLIRNDFLGDLEIDMGSGDDELIAIDNIVGDDGTEVEVNLGSGDDFLEYGENEFFADEVHVAGDSGSDTLELNDDLEDDDYEEVPLITGFEEFDDDDDSFVGDGDPENGFFLTANEARGLVS